MMNPAPSSGRNLEWCPVCERYYDPRAEHGCIQENVDKNRRQMEKWLGKFKIRDDG